MLRYNAKKKKKKKKEKEKNTGIPFVDQKNGFSLLQTLTYYTSFY